MKVRTIHPQEEELVWNPMKQRLDIFDEGQTLVGFIPKEELGFKAPVEGKIRNLKEREYFNVLTISDMEWSRKMYQNAAKKDVEVGAVYSGEIASISPIGLFVDILGDVEVFINCAQTSRTFNFPPKFFKKGEKFDVKITEKKIDENGRVLVNGSRREADTMEPVKAGEVFVVRIAEPVKGGYFCELTPNIQGIVDTMDDFQQGEERVAIIKKITSNGYIHMVPYEYA